MSIISTENSEHYKWGESSDGWHLLKSDDLSVIEELVPAGEQEQRHYHEKAQQFLYVLSGQGSLEVAGKERVLNSGHGFHIPAKVPHQLRNCGTEPLRFLVASQPKSHGDRVNA
ncbi:MAG: cupin domain-containing protein [Arenicella sp.]|jgi:mannose-6-phosphate isomerase-like protein (cupin superfamily)|nr:cupin domain-containing protein [Arenicella sp.]